MIMKKNTFITAGATLLIGMTSLFAQNGAPAGGGQPQMTPEQQAALQAQIQKMMAERQGQPQAQPQPAKPVLPEISLEEAKLYFSRNVGVNIGSQLKADKMVNKEVFLKGLNDALAGKAKAEDIDSLKMQGAQQVLQAAQVEVMKKENTEFLVTNKKKDGVKVTKSGLQYKVLKEGKGETPKDTDQVKVHYTGKLVDGTVFDSSVERGQPATFGVTQVIKGWIEGLQLMKPGAKYQFVIPSELGYGERGSRSIPPASTLVFEVELLEIIKPATATTTPVPAPTPTPTPVEKK